MIFGQFHKIITYAFLGSMVWLALFCYFIVLPFLSSKDEEIKEIEGEDTETNTFSRGDMHAQT